jgi:beta-glucanase (GH16 family)
MLRPAIFMFPETFDVWAKNGEIDIMTNIQNNKLGAGIHYSTNPAKYEFNTSGEFSTESNLNDFHTYSLEWNEFEIKWFFDDINHLTININRSLGPVYTKNGQPFDKPFRLIINLGVGPFGEYFFPYSISIREDVHNWKCSLFIIDYIRIYKWVDGYEKQDSNSNDVSVGNICDSIMSLITPQKIIEINKNNTSTSPICLNSMNKTSASIILVNNYVLLLVLLLFYVFN